MTNGEDPHHGEDLPVSANDQRPQQQPARPLAPAPNVPPRPPVPWRLTFHVVSPKGGFSLDLEREATGGDLLAAINSTEEALMKAGFKPAAPPTVAAAAAATAQEDDDSFAPPFCPECGAARSTFYNNIGQPNRPQGSPDMKCKCGKGFWKNPSRQAGGNRHQQRR